MERYNLSTPRLIAKLLWGGRTCARYLVHLVQWGRRCDRSVHRALILDSTWASVVDPDICVHIPYTGIGSSRTHTVPQLCHILPAS